MNNKSAYYGKAGASATVHGPTTSLSILGPLFPLFRPPRKKKEEEEEAGLLGMTLGGGACSAVGEGGREADDEEEEIQRRL